MFTVRQRVVILTWSILVLLVASVMPLFSFSDLPARYTNNNFFTSYQDKPLTLAVDPYGGFIGYTEQGRVFRQYPIVTGTDIRLERFEIDDAFFYVSDRGIIVADNNLIALSIYQSRA